MDQNDTMLHVPEIHILLTALSNILRWNMELNFMITLYKNNKYILKLWSWFKQEGPEGPGSLTWGKGHSVANNREPQGHNLNNVGRGPFDDVIY